MTISIAGRRISTRLAVVILAVLVVCAGGLYLAWPRPPTPAPIGEPPPRPSIPLMVSVGLPGNDPNPTVLAGRELTVTGHALGAETVAALELWDGADRVAVATASGTAPAFHARWTWTAREPGDHVLLVRAVDRLGRVAQSDAQRVTVLDAPVAIAPRGALAASGAPPSYALAVPSVQAVADECHLTLSIGQGSAGNTGSGFAVLALAPGASTFTSVGTAAPSAGSTSFNSPLPGGITFLAVTSFNGTSEVYGPPIPVAAPDTCDDAGWSGDLRLDDGRLVPAPAADRAYLYLRQDGGAAKRVPATPGAFVERVNGSFDFGPFLPALDGSPYDLEAWGWMDGTLQQLGSGAWAAPAASNDGGGGAASAWFSGSVPAVVTTLHVVETQTVAGGDCQQEFCPVETLLAADTLQRPPSGSNNPATKHFRWSSLLPNVTHLMWQVLPYSPASSPDLSPPFLIDKDTITVEQGASGGDFTLDFAPYLQPDVPLLNAGEQQGQDLQLMSLVFPNSALPPASAATPTPGPASGGSSVTFGKKQLANPIGFGSRFYVRVIPIQAGVPSFPSGPVTLDVVEPPPAMKLAPSANLAYDISFEVTLPRAANPAYARCAIVTEITSGYTPPPAMISYPDFKAHLASGEPICYQPPSDSGWSPFDAFDAFVEFVADVWDVVVSSYDWIKDKIVQAVLIAVPCKQIASDAVCEQIANTALDIALTSFGVPPSLPNFDAVVAAAKGDLAEFIVTAASGLPGVSTACGLAEGAAAATEKLTTCQALAEEAIDEAVKQMVAARSDAAAKAIGYAWPHVVFAPDPRGQYQAPSVTFTATRTNNDLVQVTGGCKVSASITSHLAGWTWDELTYDEKLGSLVPTKATGDVVGSPFLPAAAPIPELQPGQTYTRQLWLTEPQNAWTETNAAYKYWHNYEGLETPNRAWVLLQKGAELTYNVGGNCSPGVSQTHVLTQSAYDS